MHYSSFYLIHSALVRPGSLGFNLYISSLLLLSIVTIVFYCILTHFPSVKGKSRLMRYPCRLYVSAFQLLSQWIDFQEVWYELMPLEGTLTASFLIS